MSKTRYVVVAHGEQSYTVQQFDTCLAAHYAAHTMQQTDEYHTVEVHRPEVDFAPAL